MAERQYTSQTGDGEEQDTIATRDAKADTLAHDVVEREAFEKRTAYIVIAGLVALVVLSFSAIAFGLKRVNEIAESNQRVVCNLRSGYQEQYDSTVKFLKANPNGGVLLGVKFTRNDLIRQRDGIKKRIDSTKDAKC